MADGFGPLRSLGETQLQVQFTLSSMYDTQATGILALNGALLAALIATDDLVGHLWWLGLIGLLTSSGLCIFALGRGSSEVGLEIKTAFTQATEHGTDAMDEMVARSISDALGDNDALLEAKRTLISRAIAILAITILGTILGVLVGQ